MSQPLARKAKRPTVRATKQENFPHSDRTRKMLTLTLSDEARAALKAMADADDVTRSAFVEELIEREQKRRVKR